MAPRSFTALLATVAAGSIIFAGQTLVAHAVSQTVNENCYSNAGQFIPVTLEVGETFTINTDPAGDCAVAGTFSGLGASPRGIGTSTYGFNGTENSLPLDSGFVALAPGDKIKYSATAEGSITLTLEDGIFMQPTHYNVTVTAASDDGGSADTSSPGPSDVNQQIGQPNFGCAAIQDTDLNWSGVASGGWSESWAQWVNDGRGGAVCTRTLIYVNTSSSWIVR